MTQLHSGPDFDLVDLIVDLYLESSEVCFILHSVHIVQFDFCVCLIYCGWVVVSDSKVFLLYV